MPCLLHKVPIISFESHSYLTGVRTALMWWNLREMHVIFNIYQCSGNFRKIMEWRQSDRPQSIYFPLISIYKDFCVRRTGASNYIPQYLLDAINCSCPWYLLLEIKSSCPQLVYLPGFWIINATNSGTFWQLHIHLYVFDTVQPWFNLVQYINILTASTPKLNHGG